MLPKFFFLARIETLIMTLKVGLTLDKAIEVLIGKEKVQHHQFERGRKPQR